MKHTCHNKGCPNSHINTQCRPLWRQHMHIFSHANMPNVMLRCSPKHLGTVVAIWPFEQGHIVGLREAGLTYRRIAERVGHNVLVECRCFQKWSVEHSQTCRPGSVWPQSTDTCQDQRIVRVEVATSGEEIWAHVASPVSPRTIGNCLLATGLRSRVPLARLPPTTRHCQIQLLWCCERVDW